MKTKFTRTGITKILTDAGLERAKAAGVALAIIRAMADALAAGKVIEFRGLGTLETRERKARTAHNPRTLAPVNVPARRVIFFRPSGKLKNALNREGGSPM
jgi:integration host factor subunit beta